MASSPSVPAGTVLIVELDRHELAFLVRVRRLDRRLNVVVTEAELPTADIATVDHDHPQSLATGADTALTRQHDQLAVSDLGRAVVLLSQARDEVEIRLAQLVGSLDKGLHCAFRLGVLILRLLEQRKARAVRNPYLIVTEDGRNVTKAMLWLRFDDARKLAAAEATKDLDQVLSSGIKAFQFRDIRPKAASEIADLGNASKLLGHTDKRITQTVYRRVGEVVAPTK